MAYILGPFDHQWLTQIMTWINDDTIGFMWNVITHKFRYFIVSLINSLRPSDASLVQIMARRLGPAPSHYPNQCWNIVNWIPGNKLQWKLYQNSYIFILKHTFENAVWKMAPILSRPQCVNQTDDYVWTCVVTFDIVIWMWFLMNYPESSLLSELIMSQFYRYLWQISFKSTRTWTGIVI